MDGHLSFDSARRLALRLGVPLILGGVSRVQAAFALGLDGFEMPAELGLLGTLERLAIPRQEVFSDADVADWWNGSAMPTDRLPRVVFPLAAWDTSEDEVVEAVERLGLLDPGSRAR